MIAVAPFPNGVAPFPNDPRQLDYEPPSMTDERLSVAHGPLQIADRPSPRANAMPPASTERSLEATGRLHESRAIPFRRRAARTRTRTVCTRSRIPSLQRAPAHGVARTLRRCAGRTARTAEEWDGCLRWKCTACGSARSDEVDRPAESLAPCSEQACRSVSCARARRAQLPEMAHSRGPKRQAITCSHEGSR